MIIPSVEIAQDARDLHRKMVSFPSLSKSEKEIADFIENYVIERGNSAGVTVKRFDDNVYFWIGEGKDCFLMNTHLDVVPPSSNHPFDPFTPTEKDGKLYGRGSVDAKASGASMTTAFLRLANAGWKPKSGKLMVALTTCEEIGGDYNGLQRLRPHLPKISAALVGEPTELEPCISQKGLLILKVTAKGKTAHAARAHLGENAILKAGRDLQKIADYKFEKSDAFLGAPTMNVTTIEGGTARNVIPDTCTFYLDIRSTPAYSHDEITALISELLESEVTVHSKRLISVGTKSSAKIVQSCKTALPNAIPFGSPTASDWIFLHDVETVKIGPGKSELSHTPDEHVELIEIDRAVQVYQDIIRAYFD